MAQRLPGPDCVIERTDGLRVRVLLFEPTNDVVHVMNLASDRATARPDQWRSSELLADFQSPSPYWRFIEEELTTPRPERQRTRLTRRTRDGKVLPPASEKHDKKRWDDVAVMLEDPAVYWQPGRRAALDRYAETLKTTWKRLLRLLRLVWLDGMNEKSVRTGWIRSGGRSRRGQPDGGAGGAARPEHRACRLGRPPTKPRNKGKPQFDIPTGLEKGIAEIALAYLRQSDNHSRRGLYEHLVRTKFSFINGTGEREDNPEDKRPTRRQVRYIVDKVDDPVSALRRKLSPATMANDKEAKLGSRLIDAHYAGHIYEIDSTILDLWVVDRKDKSVVLGKPTLYLIIDVFSRLLVGFHVTLDPPSWAGACAALNSLVDRRGQCERAKFTRYDEELDCADGVVGQVLRADRGKDVANNGTIEFARDIKRSWENTAGKRGSLKGTVECQFKLIHVELKHDNAGYVAPSGYYKRTGKGYRFDCKLNLDELRRKLFAMQNLHNRRMHKGLHPPRRFITKGIPPQPYRFFKEDEATIGPRPRINAKRLRDALLTKGSAKVTEHGIEVALAGNREDCLHFTCPEAKATNWFITARKRVFGVDIRYDRDLTNIIYVKDPHDPRLEYGAHLTKHDAQYLDTDWATATFFKLKWEEIKAQADDFNMTLRNRDKDAQEEEDAAISAKAKADLKAAGGKLQVIGTSLRRSLEAHARAVEEAKQRAGIVDDSADASPEPQGAQTPSSRSPKPSTKQLRSRPKRRRGMDSEVADDIDFDVLQADPVQALRGLNRH